MMTSDRIDHVAEARRLADIAGSTYEAIDVAYGDRSIALMLEAQTLAITAQVHATLELAEQQRIANVFTLQSGSVNATTDPAQDLVFEPDIAGDPVLRSEIREALGLRE